MLAIKAAVRERDGFRCAGCGMTNEEHLTATGKQLDVHRVVPGSVYSAEPGVCVTLCQGCHGPQPKRRKGEPDLTQSGARVEFMAPASWVRRVDAAAKAAFMSRSEYVRYACTLQMQAEARARKEAGL